MALQLNNVSKIGLGQNLLANQFFSSNSVLRFYPNTVAYPTANINNATGNVPAGNILTYTTLTYTLSGNTIVVSAGPTTANATAAGTLGWWLISVNTAPSIGALISDSIGLSGTGSVITVNTMTPTLNQAVSFTFNLTIA